ncbi:MAG: hypothetical protein HXY34_09720 [Candidatus Thorarchaeota archaeon]|nr:hypothetical protein [Candidatus Thorarchaeota archaeon]
MKERIAAVRVNLHDIESCELRSEGDGPRFVTPNGVEMRRILTVGHVVDRFQSKKDKEFATITLDDTTGTVRVKAWDSDPRKLGLVKTTNKGGLVLVVGKLRQSQGQEGQSPEVYIEPEVIRELKNPNYITLHILERSMGIIRLTGVPLQADTDRDDSRPTVEVPEMTKPAESVRATAETRSEKKSRRGSGAAREKEDHTLPGQILEFIRANAGDKGVDIKRIAEEFAAKGIQKSEVQLHVIDLQEKQLIREVKVGWFVPS